MTTVSETDAAVRNYLLFLEDPAKLVDEAEVASLEAAVQSSSDPLAKLQAVNRLQQLRDGDGDEYRQAFCTHAKSWAEAHGIQPSSFLALGVDAATLRAAGFSIRAAAGQAASRRKSGSARGSQVRVEQVKDAVARQSGIFTLADISAASGASPMTIRKAMDELVSAGGIERLGPTPNWSQPGRAPIQFQPATAKRSRR